MATSFNGGWSRSTRREPPTMGKQLVSFITCSCELSAPFFVIYKAGREPTPYYSTFITSVFLYMTLFSCHIHLFNKMWQNKSMYLSTASIQLYTCLNQVCITSIAVNRSLASFPKSTGSSISGIPLLIGIPWFLVISLLQSYKWNKFYIYRIQSGFQWF